MRTIRMYVMNETKSSGEEKKPIGEPKRKRKNQRSLPVESVSVSFPIVGIGCSAGGLEALEKFLNHIPQKSGMAFVIIQHLDPTHQGILTELLQRITPLTVTQVTDRMQVRPDSVYVIPPNKDMSLLHGYLYLLEPVSPRGLRLPIDLFFRSLAEDLHEQAIGVILSGMGTDGTLGLKAIKEKAGAVFVQDPVDAKFTGMPLSAIDAGLADLVAGVEELPQAILAYTRHGPLLNSPTLPIEKQEASSLEKVIILVRNRTGHDFSQYKINTLYRRIERRMKIHKIEKILQYVRYLQENTQEVDLLFKEFLIGVTNFFRDEVSWDHLKDQITPLITAHPVDSPIRAWVPGCSTGEEAYSLAIVIREILDAIKPLHDGLTPSLQIYATDLDPVAIEKARTSFYPVNIIADVSQTRLSRFFVREDDGFRVGKEIRETIVFATQNLIMDPPFTKLDIISCRNLLIYFSPDLQKKILPLFHYSLRPGGTLFLGSSESIGGFSDLFSPLDAKSRIYQRSNVQISSHSVEFPALLSPRIIGTPAKKLVEIPEMNLETEAHQILLENYAPAAVLVNEAGDILFVSGKTGKYLEMSAGKANMNIYAMARESIRFELSTAFSKVIRQGGQEVVHGLKIGMHGEEQVIDLTVLAVPSSGALKGTILIVFTDLPAQKQIRSRKKPASGDLGVIEQENQHLREELSTLREEMQTSQEELRSTNEEFQSTNEELQSTNEELTTSKEEMQSLNEELQTVNAELEARVDALSRVNNDMKNLLNSTDIATVFLDNSLNVRRFTNQATTIIRLISSDVGRPLTDLTSNLQYSDLVFDANEVLRTLVPVEKVVYADDGRWFTVKIMPYRTLDNRIDGLVLTFIDVTTAKKAEELLIIERDAHKAQQISSSEDRRHSDEKESGPGADTSASPHT